MNDENLKKIRKALRDEIRPLKETVEVIKSKVDKLELFQSSTSSQVRSIRDQQSVINEKIDEINHKTDKILEFSTNP